MVDFHFEIIYDVGNDIMPNTMPYNGFLQHKPTNNLKQIKYPLVVANSTLGHIIGTTTIKPL